MKHSPLLPKPQNSYVQQTGHFGSVQQQLKFEEKDNRQPIREYKPPASETEYISVSALQEVNNNGYRDSQHYSENLTDSELKRIDSFSPLESYHEHNHIVSTEQENNPPTNSNPFSSLEAKLNSLISARKAIEKQTKNADFMKRIGLKK
jgi:hypothetical protein